MGVRLAKQLWMWVMLGGDLGGIEDGMGWFWQCGVEGY